MMGEEKPIIISIRRAREQGIADDLILSEIRKQNPEKGPFFLEAEKRGATAKEILDEIIKQNIQEEETTSKVPADLFSKDVEDQQSTLKEKTPQELLRKIKKAFSQKKIIVATGISGFFFILLFSSWIFLRAPLKEDVSERDLSNFELQDMEIASLVEPGIVKIGRSVTGEITIRDFDINLENFEITQKEDGETYTIPIDIYNEGTGFIVSSDGRIITNAHVVTIESTKTEIFNNNFSLLLLYEIFDYQRKYGEDKANLLAEKWEKLVESSDYDARELIKRNQEVFFNDAQFDVMTEVKVFNPSLEKEKLTDLFKESFDTEILYANKDFVYDQRDVAVIKIEQENLPAISLSDFISFKTGDSIYTFGFPHFSSTPDVKDFILLSTPNIKVSRGYFRPSFSTGNITSLKESIDGTFKFIEVNAKVSFGSSGSPLLNKRGEVIGILSLLQQSEETSEKELLGRAVSIEIIKDVELMQNYLSSSDYYYHFKRGLYFMNNKRCKQAIEEFNIVVENTNALFLNKENLDFFIKECELLIKNGKSVDTKWDLLRKKF